MIDPSQSTVMLQSLTVSVDDALDMQGQGSRPQGQGLDSQGQGQGLYFYTVYKDLQGLYSLQSPCKYLPTIKE